MYFNLLDNFESVGMGLLQYQLFLVLGQLAVNLQSLWFYYDELCNAC